MNIEKSFGQELIYGGGQMLGAYPITSFFPNNKQIDDQVGGSILQEGMKRLEGLAIPAGLVINSNLNDDTSTKYKTNPNINVLDENLFDSLFASISRKKGKSTQSRKRTDKVTNNVTRGRK